MSAAQQTIVLSDDDDEANDAPPSAAASGRHADAPVDLCGDDDPEPPPQPQGSGQADAPVNLDDEPVDAAAREAQRRREAAAACRLCLSERLSNAYTLSECQHQFCRSCLTAYVGRKLRRILASEVGCPRCATQMTMQDVQTLGVGSQGSGTKRVRTEFDLSATGSSASGFGPSGSSTLGRAVGTSVATKRLMRELQAIRKSDTSSQGFEVSLPYESDLYTWDATFFGFERGTALAKDLDRVPGKRILLRMAFSSDYPSAPPYVRVIRPRFAYRTGHVTIGGSICTEMLTSAGWSSAMTIESVLVGIRTNMLAGGARLDPSRRGDYSEAEAREAFNRMVREHGWF